MELTHFEVDQHKSVEGVWVDLNDRGFELEVLIARWNNPRFLNLFQSLTDQPKVRRKLETNRLEFEKQEELMAHCMARTILLNWRGMKREGEEVPYGEEVGEEVLLSVPDLREEIRKQAENLDLFRRERISERGEG